MDGIEHVGSLLEAYKSVAQTTNEQAFAYFDSDEALPLYRCLAERGVEVTPTLVFYRAVARSRTSLPTLSRDALKYKRDVGGLYKRGG